MSDIISSSLSGLNSALINQNITAQNISNVNTESYTPKEAIQTDVFPVGTKVSTIREQSGVSGTDLNKEMVDLNRNKEIYTANAKVIKVEDRMLGELVDLVG